MPQPKAYEIGENVIRGAEELNEKLLRLKNHSRENPIFDPLIDVNRTQETLPVTRSNQYQGTQLALPDLPVPQSERTNLLQEVSERTSVPTEERLLQTIQNAPKRQEDKSGDPQTFEAIRGLTSITKDLSPKESKPTKRINESLDDRLKHYFNTMNNLEVELSRRYPSSGIVTDFPSDADRQRNMQIRNNLALRKNADRQRAHDFLVSQYGFDNKTASDLRRQAMDKLELGENQRQFDIRQDTQQRQFDILRQDKLNPNKYKDWNSWASDLETEAFRQNLNAFQMPPEQAAAEAKKFALDQRISYGDLPHMVRESQGNLSRLKDTRTGKIYDLDFNEIKAQQDRALKKQRQRQNEYLGDINPRQMLAK